MLQVQIDRSEFPSGMFSATVARRLREHGFDLCSEPMENRVYNAWVSRTGKAIPLLPPGSSIVVGNTRALWPIFKNHYAEYSARKNPLDTYCRESISQCFPSLQIRFGDDVGQDFVSLQMAAHLSGLAYLDPDIFLCIHRKYGAWISLRAIILIPPSSPHREVTPALNPCSGVDRVKLKELMRDFAETKDMEKLIEVRRRVSDFTADDHSFPRDQVEYHYFQRSPRS